MEPEVIESSNHPMRLFNTQARHKQGKFYVTERFEDKKRLEQPTCSARFIHSVSATLLPSFIASFDLPSEMTFNPAFNTDNDLTS